MSNATLDETTLTRNKTIILTIPDFIAIGGFLISLGVTIGMYVKTLDSVSSIENSVGEIKTKYESLDNTSKVNSVELKNVDDKISEVKEEIKDLRHSNSK